MKQACWKRRLVALLLAVATCTALLAASGRPDSAQGDETYEYWGWGDPEGAYAQMVYGSESPDVYFLFNDEATKVCGGDAATQIDFASSAYLSGHLTYHGEDPGWGALRGDPSQVDIDLTRQGSVWEGTVRVQLGLLEPEDCDLPPTSWDSGTVAISLTLEQDSPSASFTASPNPATIGANVVFDASGSSDPNGEIVKYEWDLDGNGSYETNTGSTASTSRSYASAGNVNVGLRVTNDSSITATTTRVLTVREINRPPIARSDTWTIKPGHTADENILENDSDPDGDPIRARVLEISFARKEWSRMDPDGGFLYTAGPGTLRALNKRITYVAIDSGGARSKPAKATVKIRLTRQSKNPLKRRSGGAGISATSAPYWDGPWPLWGQLCFGSGLDSSCYTMLTVAQTQALANDQSWARNLTSATRWCFKYGFLPMKNKDCAKKLVEKGLSYAWDRSVVRNAAKFGNCLLFRVSRNRSLRHPLAGEWGKPEYHPTDSLVRPYNGNELVSGWGTWPKGLLRGRWRVPLACISDGRVKRLVNKPLEPAP